ncbi:MAG: DNA polymerase I, partial [Lachnospiraceae bacterium]|nr:DNA polymerase I [Lachnospiraceae bacterium]
MSGGLLLIDGHSIIHRAFYGLPDLTDAEGHHTGAVYGFLNILFRFIDEEQPQALAVAFDVHAPTFRHEIFPEYKGKRKPMPEELREQIPLLKEVLDLMGVYRVEQAGLEADDLLGTAATLAEKQGLPATIVSGDRDLLQVATEVITVALPKTVRGQTTVTRYHAADVEREWGVSGERFIDLKALMGDTSDNIPGLPGVGEKTARELMEQFGSGEQIFARADEISKKALREKVKANRAAYDLSRTLSVINKNAEYPFSMELAMIPEGDAANYLTPEARERFRRLGFKNLLARYPEKGQPSETAGDAEMPDAQIIEIRRASDMEKIFADIAASQSEYVGISFICDRIIDHPDTQLSLPLGGANETTGLRLFGAALYWEAEGTPHQAFLQCGEESAVSSLKEHLGNLSAKKMLSVFGAKEAYRFFTPRRLLFEDDPQLPQVFDIKIAAYLLNPLKNDLVPEDIASAYLQLTFPARGELFGKKCFSELPQDAVRYGSQCAKIAALAAPVLADKLAESGMQELFYQI